MIHDRPARIRNADDAPWRAMPGHEGDALAKLMVHPDITGSRHIEYRISTYPPNATIQMHVHRLQEQLYHVLEGEGLLEVLGDPKRTVRRNDVIFLPPGAPHRITNTGQTDLVFLVVTAGGPARRHGLLGIWHDVLPGGEEEVENWYNCEHHLERLGLVGFRRARRYRGMDGAPLVFVRYDLDGTDALDSREYRHALANPSA